MAQAANGTAYIPGAPSAQDLPPERAVLPDPFPGEFRLTRLLGEGAFGKVFLADDLNLGRQVALKALHGCGSDEAGQRSLLALRRDAHLLVQIQHPNVVQVYAWRSDRDEHYMVMQYVPGGSLADRVKANGPLPWPKAAGYIADVGEGLLEVHTCGIIHRDIKPANILWDPKNDRALLTDFGVSAHLACARTVAGTPLYMAPEAFEGRVCAASDVYSLSATLFHLLTGDLPFPGSTVDEILRQIDAGLPAADPRLSGLPAELERVLRSGLSRVPEQRIPLPELVYRLRELPVTRSAGVVALRRASEAHSAAIVRTWPSQADSTPPMYSPAPEKRRMFRPRHLMLLAAAVSTAVAAAAMFWPIGDAGFHAIVPRAVTVAAGEQISMAIQLHRRGFLGAVALLFENLPAGVKVEAATILPGQAEGLARISADLDAPPGTTEIHLRAVAPGARQIVPILLTIHEAKPPWVPEQCQPAAGAKRVRFGRSTFWDRVICRRQGLQLPLVLIPKRRADDPSPFYIMQNKVSRAMFEQFARAQPEAVAHSQWRAGWGRGGEDVDGELPVLHVTCDEAWQLAAWLGGRLPTVAQWDKAAGRYDGGGSGPFVEPWNPEDRQQIAVGRAAEGPLRVGTAPGDVSQPFGLRDMAGNGLEWTSTPKQSDAPLPPPRQGLLVAMVLRGRSFADSEPLRFKDLDLSDPLKAAALPYYSSTSAVGFRVVFDQLPFE